MDVESLYTNIPIPDGIATVSQFLNMHSTNSTLSAAIVRLLSISLYKNIFSFRDKLYIQTKGVAMGKHYGPALANIYLANWENGILTQYTDKILFWGRYIDDIFGIWTGSLSHFNQFCDFINNLNVHIKIVPFVSFNHVVFLDLHIFKSSTHLYHSIYFKPTADLKLLHRHSLHPFHMKKSVVTSQLQRFIRNCSYYPDFNSAVKALFAALLLQGYAISFLRRTKSILLRNLSISTDSTGHFLKGFFPCTCKACSHGTPKQFIPYKGGASAISQHLTCNTQNVVYAIECSLCHIKYVGETGGSLKKRIINHLSNIRLGADTSIAAHFNSLNHDISHLTFYAIRHAASWTPLKRKKMETSFIRKLNTLHPHGLNLDLAKQSSNYVVLPFAGKHTIPHRLNNLSFRRHSFSFRTGVPLYRKLKRR